MFRIRAGTARDLPFVQQWAPYSAWESMSPDEQRRANPQWVGAQTAELLDHLRTNPQSSLVLVAELAGRPAGYVLAGVQPDSTTGEQQGFFYDLFVLPPVRRQGIGRALGQAAEQLFTGAGLRKVKAISSLQNAAAVRMAESSGFKPEGLIGLKEW